MVVFSAGALLFTLRVLLSLGPATAAPTPAPQNAPAAGASSYWVASIKRQGSPAFGTPGFKVYRNVKDYGAKGDGVSDDTAAINSAVEDGNRCGINCDSSTVTPALVYFPPGTYMVSKPIIQWYYTQFVGDAVSLPVVKALPNFEGMALIDADPYIPGGNGANWYTNQNNFYRQVRNFVLDTTQIPAGKGAAGIHWQVGQATSLQNIRFEMTKGGDDNVQQGIFMDNGSGGFMTDLVFNGGKYGAFFGNQQFTTRNLTFNDCDTAIYMNWNWVWTLKSVNINNCKMGIDMANSPDNQTVGSVIVMDTVITKTPIGINTAFSENSIPHAGGTLIIDNVKFEDSQVAIQGKDKRVLLAGNSHVKSWSQGQAMPAGGTLKRVQGPVEDPPTKPDALITVDGDFFQRAKPQYENLSVDAFVSLKSAGAKGDGKTDDTDIIERTIDSLKDGQVLYVDHGAYLVTRTITIPASRNVKITGEIWPMFMATGPFFSNQDDPKPVFKIGTTSGEEGTFEMSDVIITTKGPGPGAILMEWNIKETTQGTAGLWDTHFRIGGFAGTELQSAQCAKQPTTQHPPNPDCIGSFMNLHITKESSGYFENVWLWTADHELDLADHGQIDVYNGRGMLVESQGPVWLWGTASEHSQLVQYQFQGAKDIFYALIQTETPYYQPNPDASVPFKANPKYFDPDFSACTTPGCKSAWALRIVDSTSIWGYGSGTYSFFSNYDQVCVAENNCQENIVAVDGSANVNLFAVSTKASVNMITQNGQGVVKDIDNRSNFCGTLAIFAQAERK